MTRRNLVIVSMVLFTVSVSAEDRVVAQTDSYQPEARATSTALRAAAEQVREGNRLLEEGNFGEALSKYDAAKSQLPDAPEVAYNRGLALYRLGRYGESESAFQDALKPGNPELEARARYNLGRSAHAAAVGNRENLPEAINDLGRAIGFYNDALQLTPRDDEARLNKEAAERLRAYLEKKLEAEQQAKQEKQESEKNDEDSEEEKDDQEQPSSQPSDDQEKQQDQQEGEQDGEQDPENSQEQESDQEGESEKDQQGESKDPSKSGDRKSDSQSEASPSPSDASQEQKMSEEEAEPMLQEARDAERKRREAKRMQMLRLRGRIPADKDW